MAPGGLRIYISITHNIFSHYRQLDIMDYKLFKLLKEMAYVDTFEKDDKIREMYKEYLNKKERRQICQGQLIVIGHSKVTKA